MKVERPPLSISSLTPFERASRNHLTNVYRCIAAASALCLTACASTPASPAHAALDSAPRLSVKTGDKTDKVPMSYTAKGIEWSRYKRVIIDPIATYTGSDAQFGKSTSDQDKAEIAAYMQTQFAAALAQTFEATSDSEPDALRVHVTLTGIEANTAVLSPLTKVLPIGAAINLVKGAAGKQGSFSGSVSYAVEIYDSTSNQLLRAYVTRQYPFAEDVSASVGALTAAKAGVRAGAKALVEQIHG